MTSILKTDEIQSQNGGSVVKMQTLKHPSASGNSITLASDGSATIANGTLSAGTIADAVTQPNTLYVQGKSQSGNQVIASGEPFNLSGTTDPYMTFTGQVNSFGNGSGDVTGTTVHDFKFLTKGIYFVSFSLSMMFNATNQTRVFKGEIRGNGSTSESTTVLASARDSVINTTADYDHGSATATYVGLFNPNDLINFHFQSYDSSQAFTTLDSHVTIFLIRAIA